MIDQDDGYSVRYLHMSPSVRPGQNVSAGQRIGRLVDLGDQTHLHIELFSGSKRLDPYELC
jgi:Membrane proteins related to metalloendopeptidases